MAPLAGQDPANTHSGLNGDAHHGNKHSGAACGTGSKWPVTLPASICGFYLTPPSGAGRSWLLAGEAHSPILNRHIEQMSKVIEFLDYGGPCESSG